MKIQSMDKTSVSDPSLLGVIGKNNPNTKFTHHVVPFAPDHLAWINAMPNPWLLLESILFDKSVNSKTTAATAAAAPQATYLDGVELDAGLHDIDGGEGAVGDGAADTAGGGTLEVVHEVVVLGAGGGHDGGVVGLHGWTIQVGGNSSKKNCGRKLANSIGEGGRRRNWMAGKRGAFTYVHEVRISPVFYVSMMK